uniref:Secreted protein n=1 Tax=Panstrongylus lignarius TaxID=156445 RepID=A0A224XQV4_9HEMI
MKLTLLLLFCGESLSSSQLSFFTVLGIEPAGQTLFVIIGESTPPPPLVSKFVLLSCWDVECGTCGGDGAVVFLTGEAWGSRPLVFRDIMLFTVAVYCEVPFAGCIALPFIFAVNIGLSTFPFLFLSLSLLLPKVIFSFLKEILSFLVLIPPFKLLFSLCIPDSVFPPTFPPNDILSL